MNAEHALAAHRFKPGVSGNPSGRPRGSRNKLGEAFLTDLEADWNRHGAGVIARLRECDPAGYAKAVAALVPKGLLDSGEAARFRDVLNTFISDMEDLHERRLR